MSTSVVKWSEGLSNRVSINTRKYTDHMEFAAYMAVWFITFLLILSDPFCINFIWLSVLCVLFDFVYYVFYCYVYALVLLCMFRSVYSVSLCCSVYCLCVNA